MKTFKPFTLKRDQKLTMDQAKEMFEDVTLDIQGFEMEQVGVWQIVKRVKGMVISQNFDTGEITVFGYRTMLYPKQSGYELEGRVSIKNKKRSCFTSSHLFEMENGHLIDCAIIFIRKEK